MTKPHLKRSQPPEALSHQTKELTKIVLIDYLLNRGWWAADVRLDAEFAWELIPLLAEYDVQWKEIESKDDLLAQPYFKELLNHIGAQLRNNGKWLNKKITDRKKELSQEAQSKESQLISEEPPVNVPVTRKSKAKLAPPPAKRQKRDLPDDRILSEQHESPQIMDEPVPNPQPLNHIYVQDPQPNYTFHQVQIINRELQLDYLWDSLRAGRRKEKQLLKEFNDLKKHSRAHRSDPLVDSD